MPLPPSVSVLALCEKERAAEEYEGEGEGARDKGFVPKKGNSSLI